MITSAVSDTYEELSILWYKYQICKVSPLDYKFRCQWIEAINQVGRISYLGEFTINIVGVLKIESTVSSSSRSSPLPLSVWPDRAFFVFIGNLFSYKSSPKIRLLFGYFEKNPFCSKTAVFRPLLGTFGLLFNPTSGHTGLIVVLFTATSFENFWLWLQVANIMNTLQ